MTITEMVRSHMERGEWITPYSIQASIRAKHGLQVSDAAITARIRELRRPEYGGHIVESRMVRKGLKAHEYRMQVPMQQLSLLEAFPSAHLEVLVSDRDLESLRI